MCDKNEEEIVRVLRVLEYRGPRRFVEMALEDRGVKQSYKIGNGLIITEAILGETVEILTIPQNSHLLEGITPPKDILIAAEKVSRYFKEQNITEWKLGELQSRQD
jgi:hypothetical protein